MSKVKSEVTFSALLCGGTNRNEKDEKPEWSLNYNPSALLKQLINCIMGGTLIPITSNKEIF